MYALDRAATGTGRRWKFWMQKLITAFQNIRMYMKIKHTNIYGK